MAKPGSPLLPARDQIEGNMSEPPHTTLQRPQREFWDGDLAGTGPLFLSSCAGISELSVCLLLRARLLATMSLPFLPLQSPVLLKLCVNTLTHSTAFKVPGLVKIILILFLLSDLGYFPYRSLVVLYPVLLLPWPGIFDSLCMPEWLNWLMLNHTGSDSVNMLAVIATKRDTKNFYRIPIWTANHTHAIMKFLRHFKVLHTHDLNKEC